jgi:hypothetical protein
MNNTLVRKRTQAKIRSDQRPAGGGARRHGREGGSEEAERRRAMIEADRAARAAGNSHEPSQPFPVYSFSVGPGPGSLELSYTSPPPTPAPLPGQYMPPDMINYASMTGGQSGQHRHSAMTDGSSPISPRTMKTGGMGAGAEGRAGSRQSSRPENNPGLARFPLADPRHHFRPESSPGPGRSDQDKHVGGNLSPPTNPTNPANDDPGLEISKYVGPSTFAEMGFKSKPVEDEGCVVM